MKSEQIFAILEANSRTIEEQHKFSLLISEYLRDQTEEVEELRQRIEKLEKENKK